MAIGEFELPDGRIIELEFPEGTTPEEAQKQAEAYIKSSQFANDQLNYKKPKKDDVPVPSSEKPKETSLLEHPGDYLGEIALDAAGSVVRSANRIGNTFLGAKDYLEGKGFTKEKLDALDDEALKRWGVNRDSWTSTIVEPTADILLTLPFGGIAGKGAGKAVTKAIDAAGDASKVGKGLSLFNPVIKGAAEGATSAGILNLEDIGTGAAFGGAAPVVVGGVKAVGKGIGGLIDYVSPVTEKRVGKILTEVSGAESPKDLKALIDTTEIVPGFKPTLAESLSIGSNGNVGISSLQKSLQNTDALGRDSAKSLLIKAAEDQNNALSSSLDTFVLDDAARAAKATERASITDPLYNSQRAVAIPEEFKKYVPSSVVQAGIKEAQANSLLANQKPLTSLEREGRGAFGFKPINTSSFQL